MALHIFRIVVHGQFKDLGEGDRERLRAEPAEHEPASTRFTKDGHLTYDAGVSVFSFRYEVREQSDDDGPDGSQSARAAASARAIAMAEDWLDGRGLAHSTLRVRVSDMADVWRR